MISLEKRMFFKKREERYQQEFESLQPLIKKIIQMVTDWPEIEKRTHLYGGTEFVIFNKNIGHIHGNGILDLPFRHTLREKLMQRGMADLHPFANKMQWLSIRVSSIEDIVKARKMLLISYWMKAKKSLHVSNQVQSFIYSEIKNLSLEQELLKDMSFNNSEFNPHE